MTAEAVATAGVSVRLSGNVPRSLVAGEVNSTGSLARWARFQAFGAANHSVKPKPGEDLQIQGLRS